MNLHTSYATPRQKVSAVIVALVKDIGMTHTRRRTQAINPCTKYIRLTIVPGWEMIDPSLKCKCIEVLDIWNLLIKHN